MALPYLKNFSIILASFMGIIAAFNFIVNPYDLFPAPQVKNFNAEKTEFHKHVLLTKAHAVRLYKPGGIILGTSRAEYGLDPQHPAWNSLARPVYNLGLPNGRIEEAFFYLKHAHVHGSLKQVVLGADFFMFGEQFRINTNFDRTRLSEAGDYTIDTGWFKDIVNALFTLDATYASIDTIKSQGLGESVLYLPNGMRNSKDTWKQVRAKGGHNEVFLADIRHDLLFEAGLATFTLSDEYDKPSPTFVIFSDLVRFCLEQGIELKIIISPMHAYKLETLYHMGLWDLFEYWKRRLTTMVDTENQRIQLPIPAEIWDFSGYNSITTESVPSKDNPNLQMRWYWEGSHYRHEFGDKLLSCVLGENQFDECSLGRQLSANNIEEHLANIRKAGDKYRTSHLDDIKILKSLIQETENTRNELRARAGWQPSTLERLD